MTITVYQQSGQSWITGKTTVKYIITLQSVHHEYWRRVSKESWLNILDHLWNNPLFAHTKLDVNYYNGGQVTVWTDEFKEC